jgi:hypothetical protein
LSVDTTAHPRNVKNKVRLVVPAAMVIVAAMNVAATIALLVAMKVRGAEIVGRALTTIRYMAVIAMPRIEPVVDRSMEVSRSVEPTARADKDAAPKPLRPIVAIGCAVIRRIVVIAIWAMRLHANSDVDLGFCLGSACQKKRRDARERKKLETVHELPQHIRVQIVV